MTLTQKISKDLTAIQAAANSTTGDRILRMTDAAEPYFWNGTKGRRATDAEVTAAGLN